MSPTEINRFINQKYGRSPDGRPIYRLIWSTNLTEKRLGDYCDFDSNTGGLIREVKRVVKEVLVYPRFQDRWVLERLFPPSVTYTPELPESSQGLYVDLFVYQTKDGEFLMPTLKAVEFLIQVAENPGRKLTPEERIGILKDKEQKTMRAMLEEFTDDPEILSALRSGSAVGYSKDVVEFKTKFISGHQEEGIAENVVH